MPYSVTCSTKIRTLVIIPLLFILVGILCEFAKVCVHFTVPSGRKDALFYLRADDVHIQQHIYQKDLNLCLPLYYYAKVIALLEKTQIHIHLGWGYMT